jgi:hypothetical protein
MIWKILLTVLLSHPLFAADWPFKPMRIKPFMIKPLHLNYGSTTNANPVLKQQNFLQYPTQNRRKRRINSSYLGQFSVNQYNSNSVNNPYGQHGSKYSAQSINNQYGAYGSKYSNQSPNNPYATNAPKLYDSDGNYRGRLSTNKYDPDSVSNPYGKYGSKYSPDSINNPYGAGSPYRRDSPNNPYGNGMKIYSGNSSDTGYGNHDRNSSIYLEY